MSPSLRLGDIEFLNSWPVTYALAQEIVSAPAELVRAAPAALNAQLEAGTLDAIAVSAMAYLRHADDWSLLPDLAIGSESGVNSVVLVSRVPLLALAGQAIAVTAQGATTPVLLRVLLEQAHGLQARYVTADVRFPDVLRDYPAALLIGDDALRALPAARDDYFTWDLGALWRQWTGLPMVYAVWAVRRPVAAERPELVGRVHDALLASKRWGLAHLDDVARAAAATTGFAESVVRDYFRGIRYDLDDPARAGLRRYAEAVERLEKGPRAHAALLSEGRAW